MNFGVEWLDLTFWVMVGCIISVPVLIIEWLIIDWLWRGANVADRH